MFSKHLNMNCRMWLTVTMHDLWVTLMMSDFVSVYSTKFISYFNIMLLSGRCPFYAISVATVIWTVSVSLC
jgi:hypothetical protein